MVVVVVVLLLLLLLLLHLHLHVSSSSSTSVSVSVLERAHVTKSSFSGAPSFPHSAKSQFFRFTIQSA
jgi:hypothetical protein